MSMRKLAYKYRLYPTDKQKFLLANTFGCVRWVWNQSVSVFNTYDKDTNPNPIYKSTTQLRSEHVWLKDVSAAAIQQKETDFTEFRKQFFNRNRKVLLGKPKFKSRRKEQSFRLPNQKFRLSENSIRLEKIGWIKMVVDRTIPEGAKLMSVTVSKTPSGEYYASVLVEHEIEHKPKTGKTVGIDVGLSKYATQSDGVIVANPKWFRESQTKLRKAQRSLSRRKKGSKRREKARLKVARVHRDIARKRNDFIHKYTTKLVNEYDTICVEDLNVKGMVKNRKLAKSLSDASLGRFFTTLAYKCEWYGKDLVKVGRFEPTSKTCYNCGNVKKELALSERVYHCECCGMKQDRDLNAALNIKRLGVNSLSNRTRSSCKTPIGASNVETSMEMGCLHKTTHFL